MHSTDGKLADRASRQRDLVPPERLDRCQGVVIGVGAIGRQVALQLAATGIPRLTLVDPDTVGPENLAPQGFFDVDVGCPKVEAVGAVCRLQFPALELTQLPERFKTSSPRSWPKDRDTVVFSCVDAIETRRRVWEAVHPHAAFFTDGRMAAEVIRVLASGRPALDTRYPRTLFAAGEAYVGSCTAKSTIYAASIAAGLMVGQLARWLRGQPVVPDQTLNLLAAELTASDPVD